MASDSDVLEFERSVANRGEASTHTELSAQWARINARLQNAVGEVNYRAWMRHMSLGGVDGDEVTVHAGEDGIRFLLVSGRPLQEPVAWYGPIVMNTQEQLREAFNELQKGTFLRSDKPR